MQTPFETLRKILQTEAQGGYKNTGIIGGLDKMIPFWKPQASKADIDAEFVAEIVAWLQRYPLLSIAERRDTLRVLTKRLDALTPTTRGSSAVSSQTVPPHRRSRRVQPNPSSQPSAASTNLHSPLTVIAGIGPRQAERLKKLGPQSLGDMLRFFPRRYVDYSALKPINRLQYGEEVTVIGTILETRLRQTQGGRIQIVRTIIGDGTGKIECSWFNQPWLQNQLRPGRQIQVSGLTDLYLGHLVFSGPDWEELNHEALHTGRIVPVYNLTKGISAKHMRRWLHTAIHDAAPQITEPLPAKIRRRLDLPTLQEALRAIHFPDSQEQLAEARRRLAFDELFFLQIGLRRHRAEWQSQPGQPMAIDNEWLQSAIAALPFELTGAQRRALASVRTDLAQAIPMNRLIQGDVGAGKTVIAALALTIAVCNGAQGTLMAPTSILAEQHYQSIRALLAMMPGLDLGGEGYPGIRLLQGATPTAERNVIDAGLRDGSIKVLIGTHAVIQESVEFANLGVAIVDEQHRFGVAQRAALRGKGINPHLLVMTATPIPRSLSLIVYGGLDVVSIDEMPPGRQSVETRVIYPQERERAYAFLRAQIAKGRQAFIVCPLVEESDGLQTKAAVDEHVRLKKDVFPDLRLGLLHGKMKLVEKDAAVAAFRTGETDVLVSTSVIEVGIDIPNASVMLIEGANRFGLAQLHQFRGRVGRGKNKSFCLLVSDTPNSSRRSSDGKSDERLKLMETIADGFTLAEKDLALRGPGEFLGTRQAGFADLQMARLTDLPLIDLARRAAERLFSDDPDLSKPEHGPLAQQLDEFWTPDAGDIS